MYNETTEEPSCDLCCGGKTISIHILSVSVALGIQHEMRMRHIIICGLPGSTIFVHIISSTARFSKKLLLNVKCVSGYSLKLLSETFVILRRTETHIGNVY